MAILVSFVVPGRLRGKGRHRARIARARSGAQFVQTYDDKETRNSEAMLRSLAADAMNGRPLFTGPLILVIEQCLSHPASWSKRKKAATLFVTGKPDLDNSGKLVSDSLNKVVWGDDAQLCGLHISRYYDDSCGEFSKITVTEPEGIKVIPPLSHRTHQRELAPA